MVIIEESMVSTNIFYHICPPNWDLRIQISNDEVTPKNRRLSYGAVYLYNVTVDPYFSLIEQKIA